MKSWPLRKVIAITRDWTGASVAKLECGHGWSEAASFRWPKRTRCFTCALEQRKEEEKEMT